MCIFAGCDYLTSLKGIGISRSVELFHKYKTIDDIIEKLTSDKSRIDVPSHYLIIFKLVCALYRH
jgi:exonuclease-1